MNFCTKTKPKIVHIFGAKIQFSFPKNKARFARKVVKLSLYYKSDKKFKNNTFFIKENHKTWRKTAQPIMKLNHKKWLHF